MEIALSLFKKFHHCILDFYQNLNIRFVFADEISCMPHSEKKRIFYRILKIFPASFFFQL